MFEWPAGEGFGLLYRILEHGGLAGAQSRRKPRIAIGLGIIANPKGNAAVGREADRIMGDEIVMNPAR